MNGEADRKGSQMENVYKYAPPQDSTGMISQDLDVARSDLGLYH